MCIAPTGALMKSMCPCRIPQHYTLVYIYRKGKHLLKRRPIQSKRQRQTHHINAIANAIELGAVVVVVAYIVITHVIIATFDVAAVIRYYIVAVSHSSLSPLHLSHILGGWIWGLNRSQETPTSSTSGERPLSMLQQYPSISSAPSYCFERAPVSSLVVWAAP